MTVGSLCILEVTLVAGEVQKGGVMGPALGSQQLQAVILAGVREAGIRSVEKGAGWQPWT